MKHFQNRSVTILTAIGLALAGCAGSDPSVAQTAPKPAQPVSSKPAAAIVNGETVPGDFLDLMLAEQRAQSAPGAPEDPAMKENIRKMLIRRALLVQAATREGIDKRPDTQLKQKFASQNALIGDFIQYWVKNNVPTDAEVQQEYNNIKAGMEAQKEYHPRHILLKTEADAKSVITRLGKGAKFAELAKKSLDPGSRDSGGDLGWVNPAVFVPAFSEAMIKLTKGTYTKAPVKTEYGYHVILLEDTRSVQAPPFEEVKQELQQRMQQKKLQEYIDTLEKEAKVQ
jgi:peptidyl-prolyl cis-trans isomerase C